jgi:riboflavin kinase / FMN adenylyltransferase
VWITSSLATAKTPTRIALGNFDGVHLGHQQVIEPVLWHPAGLPKDEPKDGLEFAAGVAQCVNAATVASGYSDLNAAIFPPQYGQAEYGQAEYGQAEYSQAEYGNPLVTADRSTDISAIAPYATVVTFFPHPREFFSGQTRPLLTPLEEKTLQLARLGVDQLVLLPFNQTLAQLSPEAFIEQILIRGLRAQHISVGSDFHFGKGRTGNAELLAQMAQAHAIPVTLVPLKLDERGRISSSRIRQALSEGDVVAAAQLLGRPYTLCGKVIQGQQLGRTLGFPTANLKIPSDKYVPKLGVYSVTVYGAQPSAKIHGVMNIGMRPTVNGNHQTIEVHLFNWSSDLYGQTLTVSLDHFIRPEQKFESLEALKQQIQLDCDRAMTLQT